MESRKCQGKGAPTVSRVEHLIDSILRTLEKLKELGFTYYKGKVSAIEMEEEEIYIYKAVNN